MRLVDIDEMDRYAAEFEAFHARFVGVFACCEPREAARRYLRELLAPVQCKSRWQMAESAGEANPSRCSACCTARRGTPTLREMNCRPL